MKFWKMAITAAAAFSLVACGGGGDGDSGSGPVGNTIAGSGSTIPSATSGSGAIAYRQYSNSTNGLFGMFLPKAANMPQFSSSVLFDPASGSGSISFPLFGTSQKIETSNNYVNAIWSGALRAGLVQHDGNLLMGCKLDATSVTDRTQIFASSSLTQITNMRDIDDIYGKTFSVYECDGNGVVTRQDLVVNSNGTSIWSLFDNENLTVNHLITLLQMNDYNGGVNLGGTLVRNGFAIGHLYRYVKNGSSKFSIVLRLDANGRPPSDYLLVQKN